MIKIILVLFSLALLIPDRGYAANDVCEKDIFDIMQALLTPAIAIFGSIIGWQQYVTNRIRLKHELFEKRYAVFNAMASFLASIVTSGKTLEEERHKFLIDTKSAIFLFDDKIISYLDELYLKAVDLQTIELGFSEQITEERRKMLAQKRSDTFKFFTERLKEKETIFKPYLKLEH